MKYEIILLYRKKLLLQKTQYFLLCARERNAMTSKKESGKEEDKDITAIAAIKPGVSQSEGADRQAGRQRD